MKYKCSWCKWQNRWLPCHCFKLGRILDKEEQWVDNDAEDCEFWEEKEIWI